MRKYFHCALAVLGLGFAAAAFAADSLSWKGDRVDADVKGLALPALLEQVASGSGWQVYLEPGTTRAASAKFKNLPPGEALRLLLGDLNFALVPQTNASPRLYVFRTSQKNATQLIRPPPGKPEKPRAKTVPDELIVRLRPGANIDELARALGAKVVGRIDGLNAYRLRFSDETAAAAAREQAAANADVTGVESNYVVEPPPAAVRLDSAGVPPIQLRLNPPDSSGRVIVGLIDTAVQPLGNDLDKFLLKSLSVAGDAHPDPNSPTHGTSMFENMLRAAAAVSGGSSAMQIVSVDVYGANPTTSTFDVAAGMVQAVNNGANLINLSLGSPGESPFLHDLIQQLARRQIPVFAAAGNNASPEAFYPAAYPETVSVTAGSKGQLAPYANYGSFINLMAPGSGVVYFGSSAYLVNGTSTATAFMSATAAATADSKHVSIPNAVNALLNTPAFKFTPP
jgi:hypothetical protein